MSSPIEVVGVYEVSDAPNALLIEVAAPEPPEQFDIGGFTQEEPGQPRDNWQAPWMEQWLDESGENLVGEAFDPPPEDATSSRVVFFLHYVALDRPLMTPMGPVPLPKPQPLPSRLAGVDYEPVD